MMKTNNSVGMTPNQNAAKDFSKKLTHDALLDNLEQPTVFEHDSSYLQQLSYEELLTKNFIIVHEATTGSGSARAKYFKDIVEDTPHNRAVLGQLDEDRSLETAKSQSHPNAAGLVIGSYLSFHGLSEWVKSELERREPNQAEVEAGSEREVAAALTALKIVGQAPELQTIRDQYH